MLPYMAYMDPMGICIYIYYIIYNNSYIVYIYIIYICTYIYILYYIYYIYIYIYYIIYIIYIYYIIYLYYIKYACIHQVYHGLKATNKMMHGRSVSVERKHAKIQIIIHLRAILGLCGPFLWKNYNQYTIPLIISPELNSPRKTLQVNQK